LINILLIEDNAADVDLIRDMLDQVKHPIRLIHSHRLSLGLASLETEDFDVILLDISLPDSQGLATFDALHAQAPDIPIVVLSGLGDESIALEAVRGGAQDYLVKGQVTGGLLIRAIHYAIERQRGEREREQLLAQVQAQAQQMQQIVDTVPEGVFLLDAHHRLVMANRLGREDLGVLTDVCIGGIVENLADTPLEDILIPSPGNLGHALSIDGRSFRLIARPIETDLTPSGWVVIARDITQQREIERRVQRQEHLVAVGQLAAGIAHDFNNILAVISLYGGMVLRMSDLSAPARDRVETINQQARRASNLIQQLMDFSRRTVLERGPLNMIVFLKEQIELLQHTLPENIQLELTYAKGDYIVSADPTRLQQVIINLATNARDAMRQGGELTLALRRVNAEKLRHRLSPNLAGDRPSMTSASVDKWIELSVSDTGTGIPSDVLPQIFDPFFTTKAPGQGTGLGLSQVYGIIMQHEGYIDVDTVMGQGTTFTIYLPALVTRDLKETSEEASHLCRGHGQAILVVEDEIATRRAIVESLKLLGYRVLTAADGTEAWEKLGDVDLVLSDMVMPNMGGKMLFRAIRQEGLDVKVVLMSGHPLEEEFEVLKGQNLQGWLSKPPSLQDLGRVIAQALGE